MKKIIIAMAMLLTVSQSWASLECSNGKVEDVGDSLLVITVSNTGMGIQRYESYFSIDAKDIITESKSISTLFSIVNKTVKVSSEGEEFESKVNALMVLNQDQSELSVAITTDGEFLETQKLKCKEVSSKQN